MPVIVTMDRALVERCRSALSAGDEITVDYDNIDGSQQATGIVQSVTDHGPGCWQVVILPGGRVNSVRSFASRG